MASIVASSGTRKSVKIIQPNTIKEIDLNDYSTYYSSVLIYGIDDDKIPFRKEINITNKKLVIYKNGKTKKKKLRRIVR